MRLGVEASDQAPALQDRQHEIAVASFVPRRVALKRVIKSEQLAGACAIPHYRIEWRQQRRMRRAQAAALRAPQQRQMLAMHVTGHFPAAHADADQVAAVHVLLQVAVLVLVAGAEIVGDPARLRDAERARRTEHEFMLHIDLGKFGDADSCPRQHAFAQIVDALKILAPRDHQFAKREPSFEPALFVLPAPPACCALVFFGPLEIRGLYCAMLAHMREQFVHAGAMLAVHLRGAAMRPVVRARRKLAAMQCVVGHRRKTGFVRPALEDRPFTE
jgi:hypothetical protein